MDETRYWVGVVSQSHVERGVAGGFAQLCHGKGAPLRRMRAGDWLIYYSPRTELHGGAPLKAFTAIGQLSADAVYQAQMSATFCPFRRDVAYLPARPAPIAPLLGQLSFTRGRPNWGYIFRTGHFAITPEDFALIAGAMGVMSQTGALPDGTPVQHRFLDA